MRACDSTNNPVQYVMQRCNHAGNPWKYQRFWHARDSPECSWQSVLLQTRSTSWRSMLCKRNRSAVNTSVFVMFAQDMNASHSTSCSRDIVLHYVVQIPVLLRRVVVGTDVIPPTPPSPLTHPHKPPRMQTTKTLHSVVREGERDSDLGTPEAPKRLCGAVLSVGRAIQVARCGVMMKCSLSASGGM